jgi:GntR family transcriptional regulator
MSEILDEISQRPSIARHDRIVPTPGTVMHARVYELMRRDIDEGVWKPGDLIPTEKQLARRFGVSPGTVKQAVLALVRDGMLTRRSGKGTFVTRLDLSRSFARFFRFREKDTGQDLTPAIRFIDANVISKPQASLREKLSIAPGEKILVIRRLVLHHDVPVCLYTSHLPYRLVAGLEKHDLTQAGLYDIIAKVFGINVIRAEELLGAIAAPAVEARLLAIPAGHPVISIERTAWTYGGVKVEWRQILGRSDEFRYRTQLR